MPGFLFEQSKTESVLFFYYTVCGGSGQRENGIFALGGEISGFYAVRKGGKRCITAENGV